jgi:hypothetical protein
MDSPRGSVPSSPSFPPGCPPNRRACMAKLKVVEGVESDGGAGTRPGTAGSSVTERTAAPPTTFDGRWMGSGSRSRPGSTPRPTRRRSFASSSATPRLRLGRRRRGRGALPDARPHPEVPRLSEEPTSEGGEGNSPKWRTRQKKLTEWWAASLADHRGRALNLRRLSRSRHVIPVLDGVKEEGKPPAEWKKPPTGDRRHKREVIKTFFHWMWAVEDLITLTRRTGGSGPGGLGWVVLLAQC